MNTLATIRADISDLTQTVGDLRCAFDAFNNGQARIIEGQTTTNRLLETLVRSLDQDEGDVSTTDLLRALIKAITENTDMVRALPDELETRVAMHTDGVLPS